MRKYMFYSFYRKSYQKKDNNFVNNKNNFNKNVTKFGESNTNSNELKQFGKHCIETQIISKKLN